MTVARSIAVPSRPSPSSGSAVRSRSAAQAVLAVIITALALTLLASAAHFSGGTDGGYPDSTQQWTD